VYKGVPDGLLWLDPTLEQRTNLRLADLRPVDAVNVRRGEQTFDSKADADAYIRRIRAKGETSTTTTTTTTTTTAPTTTTIAPTTTLPPPEATAVAGP
jgi:hypothetical protein